jgi:four helix bundle protein
MFKFQTLRVWQKAIDFTDNILNIAEGIPQRYQFSIGNQLKNAVISIANNIAEGSGRRTKKESRNFYNIAKGSTYEVINILVIIFRRNLIGRNREEKEKLYRDAEELAKMLSGLMK